MLSLAHTDRPPQLLPASLQALLPAVPLRLRSAPDQTVVDYTLRDEAALLPRIRAALPLTFTPYAAVQPCSARCRFCSENLRRTDSARHASQLRPGPGWHAGLQRVLHALGGLPLGLSLSGLESTDDLPWFLQALDILAAHEKNAGHAFSEKILYSNGSGFGRDKDRPQLLRALLDFGLERVEWSRHSERQSENDQIMRFRPEVAIADNARFAEALQQLLPQLPVTLVCLLQDGGVQDLARVQDYLQWAAALGVRRVVFREFARLTRDYQPNNTLYYIVRNRVRCESILSEILNGGAGAQDFEPLALTEGYYFWNAEYVWRGQVQVVFESSDYQLLHARHQSGIVYKLVYQANGALTADWDPQTHILLRTDHG